MDELLAELFDVHIVEPVIKHDKFFIVKPQSKAPGPKPLKPSSSRAAQTFGNRDRSGDRGQYTGGASDTSDAALSVPLVAPRPPRANQLTDRYVNSGQSPSPRKNNYLQSNRYQPQKLNQPSELSEPSRYGPGFIRETEGSVGPSRYEQMQRNRNYFLTEADNYSEPGLLGPSKPHY